uniref:Protein FAM47E n=1 Tax=Sus scrofa TaxID=9823 RepID=A0A8D1NJL5_PIG
PKENTKHLKKRSSQVYLEPLKKTPVSHPHQRLYEEKKPSEIDSLHKMGPLLHENGSPSIDEEFILKQFDIDSQSKPSYNVLHAVRPNPVPLELKKRMGLNKLQGPQFFQKLDYEQRLQKPQNSHKPKWVKMRYGAWYLNTKLWKKQRADEPLVDPKVLGRAQDENLAKELREQVCVYTETQ